jgi:CRISPR-associated protein Csb2
MFILGIHYLNGWAMATHPADRESPEWPPHPDRVFMALAAAYFDTDEDEDEWEAINWLEKQPPPLVVSTPEHRRNTVTAFVPINDNSSPIRKGKALMPAGMLPIGRALQPRSFPVAIPREPLVFMVWKDPTPTNKHLLAFGRLTSKVAALGHSASLVQMWVAEESEITDRNGFLKKARVLQPVDDPASRYRMRVSGPGRLQHLRERFAANLRPTSPLWHGYAEVVEKDPPPKIPRSHFDPDFIVLRQSAGRRFGLTSTLLLAKTLHATLMSHCSQQPPPEWLSGHRADGTPSERDSGHLAIFPLPHVGRPHADGHLLGLAMAMPQDVSRKELATCLAALFFDETGWPKQVKLTLGRLGECVLEMDEGQGLRSSSRPATWLGPARRWATVTPIALDRHTKSRQPMTELEEIIKTSCRRIGLPNPETVTPTPVPMFTGAPPAGEMPRIKRKQDGGYVSHTHAVITFPCAVQGPLLMGSGRYRGYGLCRPLPVPEVQE